MYLVYSILKPREIMSIDQPLIEFADGFIEQSILGKTKCLIQKFQKIVPKFVGRYPVWVFWRIVNILLQMNVVGLV
jgi:hypothetical protein